MIKRIMIFAALSVTLAACEKEEGVGFTGIGPAPGFSELGTATGSTGAGSMPTKSSASGYKLVLEHLEDIQSEVRTDARRIAE